MQVHFEESIKHFQVIVDHKNNNKLTKSYRIPPEARRVLARSTRPVVSLERLNVQAVLLSSSLQPVVSLVRLPGQTEPRISCEPDQQVNVIIYMSHVASRRGNSPALVPLHRRVPDKHPSTRTGSPTRTDPFCGAERSVPTVPPPTSASSRTSSWILDLMTGTQMREQNQKCFI